jgi:hypothetical protein
MQFIQNQTPTTKQAKIFEEAAGGFFVLCFSMAKVTLK